MGVVCLNPLKPLFLVPVFFSFQHADPAPGWRRVTFRSRGGTFVLPHPPTPRCPLGVTALTGPSLPGHTPPPPAGFSEWPFLVRRLHPRPYSADEEKQTSPG